MQQKLEQLLSEQLYTYQPIPCKLGKKMPATPNGFKDAKQYYVLDLAKDGYNVGLACETSNLIAIDCDYDPLRGYDGEATLRMFEAKYGKLPHTLTQTTSRGESTISSVAMGL